MNTDTRRRKFPQYKLNCPLPTIDRCLPHIISSDTSKYLRFVIILLFAVGILTQNSK